MGHNHIEPKARVISASIQDKEESHRHHVHLGKEEPQNWQQIASGGHTSQASWGQQKTLEGVSIFPCSHLGDKVSVEKSESTEKKMTLWTLKTNQPISRTKPQTEEKLPEGDAQLNRGGMKSIQEKLGPDKGRGAPEETALRMYGITSLWEKGTKEAALDTWN